MIYTFECEFKIGDLVYHKLPESPMGMVTGVSYAHSTGHVTVYVTFDPMLSEVSVFEWELTKERVIV